MKLEHGKLVKLYGSVISVFGYVYVFLSLRFQRGDEHFPFYED